MANTKGDKSLSTNFIWPLIVLVVGGIILLYLEHNTNLLTH